MQASSAEGKVSAYTLVCSIAHVLFLCLFSLFEGILGTLYVFDKQEGRVK